MRTFARRLYLTTNLLIPEPVNRESLGDRSPSPSSMQSVIFFTLALAGVAHAAPVAIDSTKPSGSATASSAIASISGYTGSIPAFSYPAAPSGLWLGGPSRSASGSSPSQTFGPYSSASGDLAGSASDGPGGEASSCSSLSGPYVSASSVPIGSPSNTPNIDSTSGCPFSSGQSMPTHSGSSGPFASASSGHNGPASNSLRGPAESASGGPFDHPASGTSTSAVGPSSATASSGSLLSSREHSAGHHSASAI